MNVYTETSFVLELVFEQEQCESCEQLILLAESGRIRLILPAYCLAEPHEKLVRQKKSRNDLINSTDAVFNQLVRTTSLTPKVTNIKQDLTAIIARSSVEDSKRFAVYRRRLLLVTEIIPLTMSILSDAISAETALNLPGQDTLVYASIMNHIRQYSKLTSCFLNKNTKDFDAPDIVSGLADYNCRLIPQFNDGLSYIVNHLKQ